MAATPNWMLTRYDPETGQYTTTFYASKELALHCGRIVNQAFAADWWISEVHDRGYVKRKYPSLVN